MTDGANTVEGRSCSGCALCCMVLGIQELEKPKGVWCPHCKTRKSCEIYETRPEECRIFHCGYLTMTGLDEAWKPSRSKIILVSSQGGNRLTAHVHPNRADAWRKEPYYSALKRWARETASHFGQVLARIGQRTYMILPDRDVDLGDVDDEHLIVTAERETPMGPRLEALVLHKDDPRVQQLSEQGFDVG